LPQPELITAIEPRALFRRDQHDLHVLPDKGGDHVVRLATLQHAMTFVDHDHPRNDMLPAPGRAPGPRAPDEGEDIRQDERIQEPRVRVALLLPEPADMHGRP